MSTFAEVTEEKLVRRAFLVHHLEQGQRSGQQLIRVFFSSYCDDFKQALKDNFT